MTKKDALAILNTEVDQPFIIELLVGISVLVAPIVIAINRGYADPATISAVVAGALVVIYALYAYKTKQTQIDQAATDEAFREKLNARMNETFIVQVIFGAAMAIMGIITMINYGFDYNSLMTIISGALLLIYSIYYYRMRLNLKELGEKGDTDYDQVASAKLNETFLVQLIFGCAMVGAALVTMISYGFDTNILMTLISGGLLIVYSIYYYRLNMQLNK
jgi:drug/metabolite transporter (DMT)-like permease